MLPWTAEGTGIKLELRVEAESTAVKLPKEEAFMWKDQRGFLYFFFSRSKFLELA